jgi:tetratricopeptide (TPR) repeat protein
MKSTASKHMRLQGLETSSPEGVRDKVSKKTLGRLSKGESSISLRKSKGRKLTNLGSDSTSAPSASSKSKISISSKQAASQTKKRGEEKNAATRRNKSNNKMKVAKNKEVNKNVRAKKNISQDLSTSMRHPPKRIPSAHQLPGSGSRKNLVQQALSIFEQAVKAFNRRAFAEAKALFEELQEYYSSEVEIFARAQTYIHICNFKLSKVTNVSLLPHSADELYDCGVVALNTGNFVQALVMFEKALSLRPDDSHTLYCLAATYAQSGALDQALKYLKLAVQKQPRFRHRAFTDNDFSKLQSNKRFLELLGAVSPFDLLETRREAN